MRKVIGVIIFLTLCITFYSLSNSQFYGKTIRLGMSGPLSGGLNSVGNQFLMGANLYLKNVNETGGIYGKKVEIIVKDDRYEPKLAVENVNELIHKENVFALFGIIGTSSAEAVFPLVVEHNIPFIGTYSGAEFLRNPPNPLILNARAGDLDEIEQLVHYFADEKKLKRFAMFYQNDSYGRTGLNGLKESLHKRNLSLACEGSYKRNTLSVGNALYEMEQCQPEVIIMMGATNAVAYFIDRARLSKKLSKNLFFGLSSFVEPKPLIHLLDGDGKNLIFAQVVPSPWTSDVEEVERYRDLMKSFYPREDLSYASLEGYFAARMIVEVLKEIGPTLNRQTFINTLSAFSKKLDERAVSTNRDERCRCLHKVHLSEYVDNDFYSVGSISVNP